MSIEEDGRCSRPFLKKIPIHHRVAEGGEIVELVTASLPVFACTLAGPDRQTLYLVTAPGFGEAVCAGKGLGRIEAVEVDVPGAGWP